MLFQRSTIPNNGLVGCDKMIVTFKRNNNIFYEVTNEQFTINNGSYKSSGIVCKKNVNKRSIFLHCHTIFPLSEYHKERCFNFIHKIIIG